MCSPGLKNAGLGLQDFLLTAIYQKTGIIFVTHTAYANNIIPTTMRGIMHLLYLLSTMENIPSHSRNGKLTPESLKKTCGAPASHCGGEPLPV